MAWDRGHQHNHKEAQCVGDTVGGSIGPNRVHDPCQAGVPESLSREGEPFSKVT